MLHFLLNFDNFIYSNVIVTTGLSNGEVETYIAYKVVTKRVLLVTDSHGRELHHLLERSSEYSVTAIVSPNGTLNYIVDNALLYEDNFDEVIVMAGTNDINDQGYRDFFTSHGLHMNIYGKHKLAAVILNAMGLKSEKKIIFTFHEQVRRIRRPKN
ncbi:hypothetical protein J6590_105992 [Homalodisca vitripennis]|nr:hypothetical protein J6590_105992 [Homalodisca vitripennis]